MNIKRILN